MIRVYLPRHLGPVRRASVMLSLAGSPTPAPP
jgi:hypothetical protein